MHVPVTTFLLHLSSLLLTTKGRIFSDAMMPIFVVSSTLMQLVCDMLVVFRESDYRELGQNFEVLGPTWWIYSISLAGNRVVVATAGRHVNVYDLRNMSQPEQRRESSLRYQTSCVQCYPNGTSILTEF
uniref:Uncharacterized protein n=1 Tax=Lactuca sativa TaxID=4236 RepID=A0A9R1X8N9_LACSA|nr:hypothetical protein LSAT_V11C600337750 [Lactuca sativa]